MLSFLKPKARSKRINPSDAIARVAQGTMILIDIREPSELRNTGKAKGALHIPLGQMAQQCNPQSGHFNRKLKLDKPVAIYCASGARSERAAQIMTAQGFTEVYNLGSLQDWKLSGGAVVK